MFGGFVAACLGVLFPLGSCAQEQNPPGGQAAPNAQAPLGTQEHNNVRPATKWKRFDYACEDGAKVVVYLHNGSAKVYFQDHLYFMRKTRPLAKAGKS